MTEKPVKYGPRTGILTGPPAPNDIIVLTEPPPTEEQITDLTDSSSTYDHPSKYKAPDTIKFLTNVKPPKPEEIIDLTKT